MQQDPSANPPILEQRAGQSRLLARLYRDIGLAAVATELGLSPDALPPDVGAAVARGASELAARNRVLAA